MVAIVIAPDPYKGSMAAQQGAIARKSDIRRALPESGIWRFSIENGGAGTEDAILAAQSGEARRTEVARALLGRREARCALLEHEGQCRAIIGLRFGAALPFQPN